MKKLTKLLIIPLLVLLVSGCGEIPVLKDGEQAVVSFNKEGISAEELYERLKTDYGTYALIEMIDEEILNTKYEETDEEKEYIKEQTAKFKETAEEYGYTMESLLKTQYGITSINEFEKLLSLSYRKDTAVAEYLEKNMTEKEINKYYEDEIYGDIKAKHILIAPETLDGMTDAEKTAKEKEALAEAKSIIKKLKNGENFDDLAKKYSDDTGSKEAGGDLGWFNTGEMVEAFEEAAFALKKGKYTTTPVETEFGYHIIYKVDEKDKPSLDSVKEEIIQNIISEKLTSDPGLYYETLINVREEAGLNIEDSNLKKAYNDYMKQIIQNARANQN